MPFLIPVDPPAVVLHIPIMVSPALVIVPSEPTVAVVDSVVSSELLESRVSSYKKHQSKLYITI